MKLAIRAPNWVGDLVMATPVFEAALESGRFSEIVVVVRKHLAGVLADLPALEPARAGRGARATSAASASDSTPSLRVVPIASDSGETALYRELAPDAVMLLSNSLGAAWRAYRGGVKLRAGSALSGRRILLTHSVVPPSKDGRRVPIPTAHLMRDVAGLLGVLVPDLHPRLGVRDEIVRRERERLARLGIAPGQDYVMCCPGAAFGAAKLWPPERFAAALDRLHELHGWRGVVSGGPGEEALMEAVAAASTSGVVSLANEARDLEGLKALVKHARLLLVGDSGPRWFAAAFDVPCVSIMGPNFPELTASSLELASIVRVEGLECAPCLERACPLGHHRCMRDIGVERVVAAAVDVLARASAFA
jgi:heptosyltransferase II